MRRFIKLVSILLKPWSKTQESWIAGGWEYFVLDVGAADIVEYSAEQGVIVRFEEDVIADRFILLVVKKSWTNWKFYS